MSSELATPDAETALSPLADIPVAEPMEEAAAETTEEGKPEEPAAPAEPEKPAEKDDEDNPFKRRIDRLTAKSAEAEARAREAAARAAALEARLAELDPNAAKPDAVDPVEIAKQQLRQEAEVKAFNHECNLTHAKGVAEFPDFERSIGSLNTLGVMNPTLINAALEAGDAHKVLYALGKNPEEAERIANLPPERMGAAVAKFALKAVPALATKPVSKAPEPIKPISGGGHVETDPAKMSMEEWEKKFPLPVRH